MQDAFVGALGGRVLVVLCILRLVLCRKEPLLRVSFPAVVRVHNHGVRLRRHIRSFLLVGSQFSKPWLLEVGILYRHTT